MLCCVLYDRLGILSVCTVYLCAIQIYWIYIINISNALYIYLCMGPHGCSNALFYAHSDILNILKYYI